MSESKELVRNWSQDNRVVRARSHVIRALPLAENGRPAEAERRLRDALGVFERRHQYAAAARAAATLGYLLRERGDVSRAKSTMERARVLFDVAAPSARAGAPRAQTDYGAEQEDYAQARALLTATLSSSLVEQPDNRDQVESIVTAASNLTRALFSADPLTSVCSCVQDAVDAQAVAIMSSVPGTACFASIGSMPRTVMMSAESTRDDSMTVSIPPEGKLIAYLRVHWGHAVSKEDRPLLNAVTRLTAAMVAPEVEHHLRVGAHGAQTVDGLLGQSAEMRKLRAAITDAASCPYSVLIEGETGTGKELVARALHRSSPRRGGPFCAVNCAALTDELFEAELFGYARGAFTGAVTQRPGLFEAADHGTLFLDEVGELSPRAQAKLLRVVQDGEVRRLGENSSRRVDVRLIAATNRALSSEVAGGRFRQDLLFRIAVLQIHMPPLRARQEDIAFLAEHFWQRAQSQLGGRALLSLAVLRTLTAYGWPGNVRELENVMAALAVRSPRRGQVAVAALPEEIGGRAGRLVKTLSEAREHCERECVRAALAQALGRRGEAATTLGISRQGLAKLMKRLGMTRESWETIYSGTPGGPE